MSLFYATLSTGLFLILCGGTLIFNYNSSQKFLTAFPRSKSATYLLMATAMIWFSLKIYNLPLSEFGEYKTILLAIFLSITFASFYFVPDFLGVRALAGLTLLIADALLDAAFMQDPSTRLFLVSFVYLASLASDASAESISQPTKLMVEPSLKVSRTNEILEMCPRHGRALLKI